MSDRWTAESIPPDLVAILDEQAGKQHSPGGSVRRCLADILNAYDELCDEWACALAEEALVAESDSSGGTPGMTLNVDDRIRPGMVVAVGANIGALDVDTGEIVVINRGDGGHRYRDAVNAPLSDATIAALNTELASGNVARYRKARRPSAKPKEGDDA